MLKNDKKSVSGRRGTEDQFRRILHALNSNTNYYLTSNQVGKFMVYAEKQDLIFTPDCGWSQEEFIKELEQQVKNIKL